MRKFAAYLLALALPIAATAGTGDDDHPKGGPKKTPTPTVVVDEDSHDDAWAGLLIGAGVTYWILHRRAKRHRDPAAPPVVVVPPGATCEDRIERVQEACLAK